MKNENMPDSKCLENTIEEFFKDMKRKTKKRTIEILRLIIAIIIFINIEIILQNLKKTLRLAVCI